VLLGTHPSKRAGWLLPSWQLTKGNYAVNTTNSLPVCWLPMQDSKPRQRADVQIDSGTLVKPPARACVSRELLILSSC
jgi:type IV secretory pathway protease TraF